MITNDYGEKARCYTQWFLVSLRDRSVNWQKKVIQQESDRLLMLQTLLARLGFLYLIMEI